MSAICSSDIDLSPSGGSTRTIPPPRGAGWTDAGKSPSDDRRDQRSTAMERYRRGFPDFDELDVELPDSWMDESHHNDVCPTWRVAGTDLYVAIDYASRTSEPRFAVYEHSDDGERSEDLALTDDWLEVLECVALYLEGFLAEVEL